MNNIGPAPTTRNIWKINVPHPLEGRPLTEQITNQEADAYVASLAPEGWVVSGKPVQGRTRGGRRVICTVFERFPREPKLWDSENIFGLPTVVTLTCPAEEE